LKTRNEKPVYRRSSRQGMCLLRDDLIHSESSDSELVVTSGPKSTSQKFNLHSLHKKSDTELNISTNVIEMKDEVLEDFIKKFEK